MGRFVYLPTFGGCFLVNSYIVILVIFRDFCASWVVPGWCLGCDGGIPLPLVPFWEKLGNFVPTVFKANGSINLCVYFFGGGDFFMDLASYGSTF